MTNIKPILFITLLCACFYAQAQELNCKVQVIHQQASKVDPSVFRSLESGLSEFMNSTVWTNDEFLEHERIDCSFLINITKEVSLEKFEAQITIQSSRPVFFSNYQSVLINHVDNDVSFTFDPFEPLEFNENAYLSELTSLLGFYAYLIIGMDYDSYAKEGGSAYFLKAQTVVNNAQSSGNSGWKRFENRRNRYWIVENILNPRYAKMREAIYSYHLKGLDQFYARQGLAISMMTRALREISAVNRENPSSIFMTLFVNAKSDEIINVYKGSSPGEKAQAVSLMTSIDPAQVEKYQEILKR